jgi:hypothetical protein
MNQSRKIVAGLSFVTALLGLTVSGTASALPEMEVGSHPIASSTLLGTQADAVDQDESNAEDDTATSGTDAQAN